MTAQILAAVIFVGMFALIIMDKFERQYVTLGSAALVLVVVFGICMHSWDAIKNALNLGAIFRSAAALGMDAVLLTSAGSDPLYRRAVRVSMGTVFQVPWAYLPEGWTELLHTLGFRTAAMALRDDSLRIDDKRLRTVPRLAIVLGTEGDGLASNTIAACDYTVRIPMTHGVDSLNVAAASAVAFYQLALLRG